VDAPGEALRRPVHDPPEHGHDAIWDVAPRLVAGLQHAPRGGEEERSRRRRRSRRIMELR